MVIYCLLFVFYDVLCLKNSQVYQSNNSKIKKSKVMIPTQSYISHLSYSSEMSPLKIDSSLGTEATSSQFLKKRVSLCICQSSVSLEQLIEKTNDKELFARYLNSLGSHNERIFLDQITQAYEYSYRQSQNKQVIKLKLSQTNEDQQGQVLSYFISIWLKHMGYGTRKTKKYLLQRVRLFIGESLLQIFTKIYEDLNLLVMNMNEKRQFLLETCKNGWQYFIQEIIKKKILDLYIQNDNQNNQLFKS